MSENKLKPCPFCGCDVIEIEPMNRWRKSVTCKNCHVKFIAPDNTTLIRLWNTRRPIEQIVEQLNTEAIYEDCPVYEGDKEQDYYIRVSNAIEIIQKGGA